MFAIKKLKSSKGGSRKTSLLCQNRDELNRKVDKRGIVHDMPRTHGCSVKAQRCYRKQDWGPKSRTNAIRRFDELYFEGN
ncbi:hypothetical protein [Holospora curviuscula]|uniref:Uncharacterized protein n=1 Tax=Holospora curviuscula TaxID=1082868 RepID=A0A2S5R7A9_9PROT|nr:hypothetical protein [Holospora curviuscula]PPE03229.1 hypothetical protein HCUR_01336 [Holospora curviuscula]